jgi:hypothetical protein
VWSLEAGGSPVRLFPLTDEAWPEAWRAFHELEAAPAEPAMVATGEPVVGAATDAPVRPPLTDLVTLDYRGRGYGLGRTRFDYAIWDLTAGGGPVEMWPLRPEAWRDAWGRFQELEAAVAPTPAPAAGPAGVSAAAPELAGVVAVDYRGSGFGLGRTADAYAIWDLGAGGGPIRTFPLHPSAWPEAWAAFQELESPGPRG